MSSSLRAASGAIVTRSSMLSAMPDVGSSSDTGAARRRASAATAAAPWPMIARESSAVSSEARRPVGRPEKRPFSSFWMRSTAVVAACAKPMRA